MKIAIIGSSAIALEASLLFNDHGADVKWFRGKSVQSFGDFFEFTKREKDSFTTERGLQILHELKKPYKLLDTFSWENWEQNYVAPLSAYLESLNIIKNHQVKSLSKRYLASQETIPHHSRFYDLFRIIYEVDTEKLMAEQKKDNPELFEKLSNDIKNPLSQSLEMFEDFDLVLDCRDDLARASSSVTGRALGEQKASLRKGIFYADQMVEKDFFESFKKLDLYHEAKDIAFVGSGPLAAEIFLKLTPSELSEEGKKTFHLISHEEDPFSEFLSDAEESAGLQLKKKLKMFEDHEYEAKNKFEESLTKWKELDDFIKVKISRPEIPCPRLNFFSAHNLSAMDFLEDQSRFFLTLECPSFRNAKKHTENNLRDLKTIGVDLIFVCHHQKERKDIYFNNDEIGYFELIPQLHNLNKSWTEDLKKLKVIENEIFKLFSSSASD